MGKQYEGTFTPGGLVGKVFMRKAEVPFTLRNEAHEQSGLLDGNWNEVGLYDACKIVVRKSGAVVRWAHQHYGGNRCCQRAQLKLQGHATYGVSKASMTIWMRASLDAYWPKSWPKARVVSWTRTAENTANVVVESSTTGTRYEIKVERGLTDGSNIVRNLDEPVYEAWLARNVA